MKLRDLLSGVKIIDLNIEKFYGIDIFLFLVAQNRRCSAIYKSYVKTLFSVFVVDCKIYASGNDAGLNSCYDAFSSLSRKILQYHCTVAVFVSQNKTIFEYQRWCVVGVFHAVIVTVKCGVIAADKLKCAVLKFKFCPLRKSETDCILESQRFTVLLVTVFKYASYVFIVMIPVDAGVMAVVVDAISSVFTMDFYIFNVTITKDVQRCPCDTFAVGYLVGIRAKFKIHIPDADKLCVKRQKGVVLRRQKHHPAERAIRLLCIP